MLSAFQYVTVEKEDGLHIYIMTARPLPPPVYLPEPIDPYAGISPFRPPYLGGFSPYRPYRQYEDRTYRGRRGYENPYGRR